MKNRHLMMGAGVAVLLVSLSLLAIGQSLRPTDLLRRTLIVNSRGEVVEGFEFTNRFDFAKDPVPLLGEPPRTVVVKSGGEVVARVVLTNRASVHLPTGRFQVIESAGSVTYRGAGLLTLDIVSAHGNGFTLIADEIELLW